MESEYIDIEGKWGIVVCYDFDRNDKEEMSAYMDSFGMSYDGIDTALNVLLGQKNSGLCITSFGLRMSLIFVGEATSRDQWWDTLAHEMLDHAKVAICDYYDVSLHGEDSAWLTGYLMRMCVKKFGVPCL